MDENATHELEFFSSELDEDAIEALHLAAMYTDGTFGSVEDYAVAPQVHWSEADHAAALRSAESIYGTDPGVTIELVWPPERATLWSPGYIGVSDEYVCRRHVQQPESSEIEDCEDCAAEVRFVIESKAVWKFTTEVLEVDGECVDAHFEVCEIEQDPRDLQVQEDRSSYLWRMSS